MKYVLSVCSTHIVSDTNYQIQTQLIKMLFAPTGAAVYEVKPIQGWMVEGDEDKLKPFLSMKIPGYVIEEETPRQLVTPVQDE